MLIRLLLLTCHVGFCEWTIFICFLLVEAKVKYSWLDFDESNVAPLPPFQVWPLFLFINSQKGHIPDFLPSQSTSLPKHICTFSSTPLPLPNPCYPFLLPLLFAPDQLIMSGKEGHYPEVISWVLSGWCISPAWWRNTLIPERLSFSFPFSVCKGRKRPQNVAQVHRSETKHVW